MRSYPGTSPNATDVNWGAISVQPLYTLYSDEHRSHGVNFSHVACTVKNLGHWSAKYALIRKKLLFSSCFTDEVNGKYSEESTFLLGPSWAWYCLGGRLLLAGQKSCWVISRRAVQATKGGEHPSARRGAQGDGWDMESCGGVIY